MKSAFLTLLLALSLPAYAAPEGQSQEPQEPEAVDAKKAEISKTEDKKPEDKKAEEVPEEFNDQWTERKFAILQGLNKVTARTSEIKVEIGKTTKFGNLEISVEKCMRGPDDEKVENVALFTIWDEIPGQDRKQVFHGWMLSSSPALSALEHPIYDVILQSCVKK